MKKHLIKLPFLAVLTLGFYLISLIVVDTGTAMIVMLVGLPVLTAVVSAVYGSISGFIDIIYCVAVGALFLLAAYIYMNDSAFIYAGIYAIIALVCNSAGALLKKATSETKSKENTP